MALSEDDGVDAGAFVATGSGSVAVPPAAGWTVPPPAGEFRPAKSLPAKNNKKITNTIPMIVQLLLRERSTIAVLPPQRQSR